jgi:hypothetical protein
MKINKCSKELLESKLVEDSEPGIDTTSSVDEIADEIVDEIETASGGSETMSDEKAAKIAAEVKAVADDTGIGTATIDMPDVGPLGVENDITRVLDMSLAKAKKNKKRGTKSGYNVLVIGLPGSGKTASIRDWAASKGVNLVMVNAKNNDLDAYINGYTTKDPDRPRKVVQAFSDNLAELEKDNSVLFLDEYNRQVKPHIRASLYTLINEHMIVGDGPNGMHEFKNMLFTIAAINPAVPTDKGAADLNDAEKSRFWWTLDDMDSDAATTIEYLTKYYNKLINSLDPADEDYRENLEDYLRIQDLGIFIVSHPKFGYDTKDDLEELAETKRVLLCQRALTTGLHNADGDVDEFKFWVEKGSKFLPRKIDDLLAILKSYIKPTFEKLCADRGIDPAAAKVATPSTGAETSVEEPETASSLEDDDDFFTSSKGAGTVRVKNPYEVEVAIANAIKDW